MNIISNSCCGAYLMRNHIKTEYVNPFCWNVIDLKSYYYLIKNYASLDFLNYKLYKDENWNFSIVLNDNIKIQFVHYLFDKNAIELTQKSDSESDILLWNKMWVYVVEKYVERTKRMLQNNEHPIFIIADIKDNSDRKYDEFWLKKIDELETSYKVILVSNHYSFNYKKSYRFTRCKNNCQLSNFIFNNILLNRDLFKI